MNVQIYMESEGLSCCAWNENKKFNKTAFLLNVYVKVPLWALQVVPPYSTTLLHSLPLPPSYLPTPHHPCPIPTLSLSNTKSGQKYFSLLSDHFHSIIHWTFGIVLYGMPSIMESTLQFIWFCPIIVLILF